MANDSDNEKHQCTNKTKQKKNYSVIIYLYLIDINYALQILLLIIIIKFYYNTTTLIITIH